MTHLPCKRLNRVLAAAGLIVTFHFASSATAFAGENKSSDVSQLIYKSALFPFFQEDYFAGMTAIHIAQEKGQLSSNADQADLLLASAYLSYGMYAEAETIFLRLARQVNSAETLDRIWLQLAEVYYRTQDYDKASNAISRIGKDLPANLLERKNFLQGNVLSGLNELQSAFEYLTSSDKESIWYYYGLYNVGVKALTTDQASTGENALSQLIKDTTKSTAEIRALQDKARVVLGYHYLKANNTKNANKHFADIAIDSQYSLWGLYGLGRSAYAEQDYKNALKYWLALEQHTSDTNPIIEVNIATSQLFFRLGALQQSLDGFNKSVDLCSAELQRIDAAIAKLSDSAASASFLHQLLSGAEFTSDNGELNMILQRTDFTDMLVGHGFHRSIQNYNELQAYKKHLTDWQTSMDAFEQILDTRQRAFAEKLPQTTSQHAALKINELQATYQQLVEQTKAIEASQDARALANEQENKHLLKLEKISGKLEKMKANLPPDQYQAFFDRYQRLAGILNWNLATDFKPRLRKMNKELKFIGEQLTQTEHSDSTLQLAQQNTPNEFTDFKQRITEHRQELASLISQIDDLLLAMQEQTKQQIISKLEIKKRSVTQLLTHAQFAVAQIYDMSIKNPK